MSTRIIITVVILEAVGAVILATTPSGAPMGFFGWAAVVLLALGGLMSVAGSVLKRVERHPWR